MDTCLESRTSSSTPSSLTAHLQSSVFKLSKDLIAVTGHTSPAMLKKYIKAENLKVVEKLTDKYDYFR